MSILRVHVLLAVVWRSVLLGTELLTGLVPLGGLDDFLGQGHFIKLAVFQKQLSIKEFIWVNFDELVETVHDVLALLLLLEELIVFLLVIDGLLAIELVILNLVEGLDWVEGLGLGIGSNVKLLLLLKVVLVLVC